MNNEQVSIPEDFERWANAYALKEASDSPRAFREHIEAVIYCALCAAYRHLSPFIATAETSELERVIETVAGDCPKRDEKTHIKTLEDKLTKIDNAYIEIKGVLHAQTAVYGGLCYRFPPEDRDKYLQMPSYLKAMSIIHGESLPSEETPPATLKKYADILGTAFGMKVELADPAPTTIDLPFSDVNFYILKDQCVKQSIEIRFLKRKLEDAEAAASRYLQENCRHSMPETKSSPKKRHRLL